MHELSLMASVRDLALQQARAHGAGRITGIRLRIGSLAGVDPEALRFACAVVMRGSAAEGARLRIDTVPARGHCEPCRAAFAVRHGSCLCPRCGEVSRRLLQGRELELAELEIL